MSDEKADRIIELLDQIAVLLVDIRSQAMTKEQLEALIENASKDIQGAIAAYASS